ncbi:MAG TPA: Ig-like domain-containing protein [Tepidiformaceae bacterium]
MAAGTATVSATSEGKSGSATVTVTTPLAAVASVSVSPVSLIIGVGPNQQLTATPRDANAAVLTGRRVTWKSSDPAVVTVWATGFVDGVAEGTATVTATCEGKSGSAVITVATVATVVLAPSSASLARGRTLQLTATLRDSNGRELTGRTIGWVSSSHSGNGLIGEASVSQGGLVTASNTGTATITALSEGKSGTATITVPPLASVAVRASTGSLTWGESLALSAVAIDSAGNDMAGLPFTWSSSADAIVHVSNGGVVLARSTGTANITATTEGHSGTAIFSVSGVPGPPIVTTLQPIHSQLVSGVYTITFRGDVFPTDSPATVTFTYRRTSVGGTTSYPMSAQRVGYSWELTVASNSMQLGNSYEYWISATNSYGTTRGSAVAFQP